jgi:ABC-type transporter Mla subunit MlaD
MAEANNKQENHVLHVRLDKEIKMLTAKFTEQLNQALDKLTQVSSELNSSKTDRKTLAKLLATVASNLETDEGE